jgi:hypothetical protein
LRVIVGGGGATYAQTEFVALSEVVMTGDVARADVVTPTVDPYADRDDAVDALFRRHCADLVRLTFCLLGDQGGAEESSRMRSWPYTASGGDSAHTPRRSLTNALRSSTAVALGNDGWCGRAPWPRLSGRYGRQ